MKAVEDNKVDEVEALLKSGASPDACDSNVCYCLSDSFCCLLITTHSIVGISCTCYSLYKRQQFHRTTFVTERSKC